MTDEPMTGEPAMPHGPATPDETGAATPTKPTEPSTPTETTTPLNPVTTREPPIPIGTPVRDTTRNRVGVVMDHQGPCFQLRPLDGGREWDVAPEHVEPISPREILHARVAEANHRSRQGPRG